jgi:hypothetical protein
MNKTIFVRSATHLRFYVGILECQIQIWWFKSQNKSNCHYSGTRLERTRLITNAAYNERSDITNRIESPV